jgi:phage gp36-like protein
MAYVTRSQVEDKVPPPVLLDALDDDGDGVEDDGRFDSVVSTASQEVDGYLAGLFTVPFDDPAPPKVRHASLVFVLELIYSRRSVDERSNPYAAQGKFWREHLQKVGNRDLPMDAAVDKAFVPGAAIVEDTSINTQMT